MPTNPRHNLLPGHGPRLAGDLFASSEKDQGWKALNGMPHSNRGLLVAVDLGQSHSRLQAGRCPFESRVYLPAITTPRRPELNKHRNIAVTKVLLEFGGCQDHRAALKQGQMTLPASGMTLGNYS